MMVSLLMVKTAVLVWDKQLVGFWYLAKNRLAVFGTGTFGRFLVQVPKIDYLVSHIIARYHFPEPPFWDCGDTQNEVGTTQKSSRYHPQMAKLSTEYLS